MEKKLKIWHISDTHGLHHLINLDKLPRNVDIVIHSGDESDHNNPAFNFAEFESFVKWYKDLPIPHKILVPGNHSATIAEFPVEAKKILFEANITLLQSSGITIDGIHIYGDPYSPVFMNWYFMETPQKIKRRWESLPDDIDILVTHTPPRGRKDKVMYRGIPKSIGCRTLAERVKEIKPKFHLFGHIHDNGVNKNYGSQTLSDITYVNSALLNDDDFSLSHDGHIFEIKSKIIL